MLVWVAVLSAELVHLIPYELAIDVQIVGENRDAVSHCAPSFQKSRGPL